MTIQGRSLNREQYINWKWKNLYRGIEACIGTHDCIKSFTERKEIQVCSDSARYLDSIKGSQKLAIIYYCGDIPYADHGIYDAEEEISEAARDLERYMTTVLKADEMIGEVKNTSRSDGKVFILIKEAGTPFVSMAIGPSNMEKIKEGDLIKVKGHITYGMCAFWKGADRFMPEVRFKTIEKVNKNIDTKKKTRYTMLVG